MAPDNGLLRVSTNTRGLVVLVWSVAAVVAYSCVKVLVLELSPADPLYARFELTLGGLMFATMKVRTLHRLLPRADTSCLCMTSMCPHIVVPLLRARCRRWRSIYTMAHQRRWPLATRSSRARNRCAGPAANGRVCRVFRVHDVWLVHALCVGLCVLLHGDVRGSTGTAATAIAGPCTASCAPRVDCSGVRAAVAMFVKLSRSRCGPLLMRGVSAWLQVCWVCIGRPNGRRRPATRRRRVPGGV